MKYFIFILCFGFTGISQAQKAKVKVDGDTVLVNGEQSFILENAFLSSSIKMFNMRHELLATFDKTTVKRRVLYTNGETKEETINYLKVTFNNQEQSKCELGTYTVKKLLAMTVVKNGLVENGELNNDNVIRFCNEIGFYWSTKYGS
jgi:hypothetical protein